jgi:glycosyltransferase involved in cell wall biosynthesis
VRFHPQFLPTNALPLVFRDRLVPSMAAHSWWPFRLGPRKLLDAFAGYDVAQFEHAGRARWMRRTRTRLKVYASHNVEVDYLRYQPTPRALRETMLRQVQALERRAVRDSDLVVACTGDDAARLRDLYGPIGTLEVIPNGFDAGLMDIARADGTAARRSLGIPLEARLLLFVGSAAPHNVEAVRFLQREVLPRLDARVHLLVVGDCGPATREEPASAGRVHRPGYSDDLSAFFAAADLAVNPVITGSGSNLKMAEYLATGLPVLTTRVGLRGFEDHAEGVIVARREDFAAAIADASLQRDQSRTVEALSWDSLARRVHGVYARLLATRRW